MEKIEFETVEFGYRFNRKDSGVVRRKGFCLVWAAKGIGFGEAIFYQIEEEKFRFGPDVKWYCDDEFMGMEFIDQLLLAYAKKHPIKPNDRKSRERIANAVSTLFGYQDLELESDERVF